MGQGRTTTGRESASQTSAAEVRLTNRHAASLIDTAPAGPLFEPPEKFLSFLSATAAPGALTKNSGNLQFRTTVVGVSCR